MPRHAAATKSHAKPQAVHWANDVGDGIGHATDNVEDAIDLVSKFIKDWPLVCLAGAVALGYLVGRMVRT
jgi:hypothetical protein